MQPFLPFIVPPPGTNVEKEKKPKTSEEFELYARGGDTSLKIVVPPGRTIVAESGAMIAKKGNVELGAKLGGSFFKAAARKLFAAEKFFMQSFTADPKSKGGEVWLGGPCAGDIAVLELDDQLSWFVHKDGFLAASSTVELGTGRQSLWNGCCSGVGVFLLQVSGKGSVFLNARGAVNCLEVGIGEELQVDNGHLVAWPTECKYTVGWATKTVTSSVTSGEGVVCKFTGPAKVLVQSQKSFRPGQKANTSIVGQLCGLIFTVVLLFGAVFLQVVLEGADGRRG